MISFVFGIMFLIAAIVFFILALVTDYGSLYHIIWLILFTSGIILMVLGVIGEYLSKTYLEVKKRPVYIIKETNTN